ncbi:sigma-70 family RNA polymerase sigma factor [Allokutzneria sp. A3M-2-11 16]|uniref:sigma-70 family RNA polymerase sigma factor n=1 Tax=Allokutzneria sp. A3M-2-11 16 TaxID=2962043 RepID=UPI0027E2B0FA|nr:sigma-70 family RNA polymerase sigma factor [Allokutzneria sp. A3M-2-11 16]
MNGVSARRQEPRLAGEEPDLMRQYLNQIAATPLLTAEQEVWLARRIEAGVYARHLLDRGAHRGRAASELELVARDGAEAKAHMIRANLRLVVATAKKYARRGVGVLDVVQEGNLGLIRAVEKFDYTKGFKFSTYGTWWIRQAIDRGMAEQGRTIRLPVHVVETLSKLAKVERELQSRLDREPTAQEVAITAGVPVHKVVELRRVGRESLSLDSLVGTDGETRVGDLIQDTEVLSAPDVIEYRALANELRAVIEQLPPREALIITMRYGLNDGRQRTLQEIADHLGLTRERIRQLEKEAMRRLRDPQRHQGLLDWAS